MTWTSPFTAVVGATITASGHNTSLRDNLNHLRALLPDAGAANYWLQSSATTTAAWVDRAAAVLAAIGYTPVNRAGDTGVSGTLTFTTDGIGIKLSQNGILTDYNTDGTTLFAGDDVFRVLNQAASVVIFRAASADAAPTFKGYTIWHSNNDGTGSGLDADTVDGSHASAFALAAAGVPSGLIAMVTNAAAIPSGWSRESGLNGRVPVGDDLGVTYTSENNYGAATHTHSGSDLSISGATGGPSATDGLGNGGGTSTPTANHTHDQGTLDVAGNTAATANLPLARAYVFVRKD